MSDDFKRELQKRDRARLAAVKAFADGLRDGDMEMAGAALVLPAVRTRASLARSSIVIHVGIPAGQIGSLPVIRFIPGLIRIPLARAWPLIIEWQCNVG